LHELTSQEQAILEECEQAMLHVREQLSNIYLYSNGIKNVNNNRKVQNKYLPAQTALAKIIRAIKKRDYMLLMSDEVPEVNQIAPVWDNIQKHHADLKDLRQQHKKIHKLKFGLPSDTSSWWQLPFPIEAQSLKHEPSRMLRDMLKDIDFKVKSGRNHTINS
jgi:hypothetical protein